MCSREIVAGAIQIHTSLLNGCVRLTAGVDNAGHRDCMLSARKTFLALWTARRRTHDRNCRRARERHGPLSAS
jgi:hypothetical protein